MSSASQSTSSPSNPKRLKKLQNCSLFLLDLDGTLYLGDELLPGALELVRFLTETGRRTIYFTNNSSRAVSDYVTRLTGFGFPCTAEDVFTAGSATAMYIRERYPGREVYPLGTPAFERELESFGIPLGCSDGSIVVAALDSTLTYEKTARATHLLRAGAVFLATNPDLVYPIPGGRMMPDCGSICAMLRASSDREPIFIGKPERRMVDLCAERAGVPNSRVCCVGDRLYTDIAAAENAGAVSALVLTGETTREMLQDAPQRPDYVFRDTAELLESVSDEINI
jgi:HAD superfamily hydrolase (TIGR01450 family)